MWAEIVFTSQITRAEPVWRAGCGPVRPTTRAPYWQHSRPRSSPSHPEQMTWTSPSMSTPAVWVSDIFCSHRPPPILRRFFFSLFCICEASSRSCNILQHKKENHQFQYKVSIEKVCSASHFIFRLFDFHCGSYYYPHNLSKLQVRSNIRIDKILSANSHW